MLESQNDSAAEYEKHLFENFQCLFFQFHFVVSCRPFTVPQVLRKGNKAEDNEEGEDEEDEEEETIPVLKSF